MAFKFKPNALLKLEKDERYEKFIEELKKFTSYFFRNYMDKEKMDKIQEMLAKGKYAKLIKKACKEEETNPFPDGFSFILTEFIQKNSNVAKSDDDLADVLKIYTKAIDKMCKRRAKAISKDLGIPKDSALELAVIYPGKVLHQGNTITFVKELQRRLFSLQRKCNEEVENGEPEFKKCDFAKEKIVKKLYKNFFLFDDNEEIENRLFTYLMLEKKSAYKYANDAQNKLFETITTWLLSRLEKLPIKQLEKIIKFYIKKRDNDNNDSERRVNISGIDATEYPKIAAAFSPDKYRDEYKKFIKKDKKKKKDKQDKNKKKNKKDK